MQTNWGRGGLESRTRDGDAWRTVAEALRIPKAEYVGRFSEHVDDAEPLQFMLRD